MRPTQKQICESKLQKEIARLKARLALAERVAVAVKEWEWAYGYLYCEKLCKGGCVMCKMQKALAAWRKGEEE